MQTKTGAGAEGGAHGAHGAHGHGFDVKEYHFELLQYLTHVLEYFGMLRTEAEITGITNMYATWFAAKLQPTKHTSELEVWEVWDDFKDMREALTRMSVIKRTNFIPSGYGLMQILVYITVVLTALARYSIEGVDVPAGGGGRRLAGSTDSGLTERITAYSNLMICEGVGLMRGRADPCGRCG